MSGSFSDAVMFPARLHFFFSLWEKRVFRSGDDWVRDGVEVAVAQLSARDICFGTEEERPLVRRA